MIFTATYFGRDFWVRFRLISPSPLKANEKSLPGLSDMAAVKSQK